MVLHLADHLDIPLRERNRLLVAAGYAPLYQERLLEAPEMAAAYGALRLVLDGHEPYPALVLDRQWNLVLANSAVEVFLEGVDPMLLKPPINMMRLGLHPRGFALRLVNLSQVRTRLLIRLARQVSQSGDERWTALSDELISYGPPVDYSLPMPDEIALPIRIRHHGRELSFINTIATFGTADDITLAEITIEAYFPADEATASALRTSRQEATPPLHDNAEDAQA
jgi:hypothetical protein